MSGSSEGDRMIRYTCSYCEAIFALDIVRLPELSNRGASETPKCCIFCGTEAITEPKEVIKEH